MAISLRLSSPTRLLQVLALRSIIRIGQPWNRFRTFIWRALRQATSRWNSRTSSVRAAKGTTSWRRGARRAETPLEETCITRARTRQTVDWAATSVKFTTPFLPTTSRRTGLSVLLHRSWTSKWTWRRWCWCLKRRQKPSQKLRCHRTPKEAYKWSLTTIFKIVDQNLQISRKANQQTNLWVQRRRRVRWIELFRDNKSKQIWVDEIVVICRTWVWPRENLKEKILVDQNNYQEDLVANQNNHRLQAQ